MKLKNLSRRQNKQMMFDLTVSVTVDFECLVDAVILMLAEGCQYDSTAEDVVGHCNALRLTRRICINHLKECVADHGKWFSTRVDVIENEFDAFAEMKQQAQLAVTKLFPELTK